MTSTRTIFRSILIGVCIFILPLICHSVAGNGGKYDRIIRSISVSQGIRASLIHALIKAESDYDPFAVSKKGASGLMQLMPETAEAYNVQNVFDPYENIEAGVKYFKKLLKKNDGNVQLALAAYNAGQSVVEKYGGVPPYPETRRFIKKVNSFEQKISGGRSSKIYTFYDASGRLVITNIPPSQRSKLR